MSRIIQLLVFYVCLLSSAVFFESCCRTTDIVTIVGAGELSFSQDNNPSGLNFIITDTIVGVPFNITTNFDLEFAAHFVDDLFTSSAYGFSCEVEYSNPPVESSVRLSCNEDFVFNGMNVPAGMDISSFPGVTENIGFESGSILFDQAFVNSVDFPQGPLAFTFSMMTVDNLMFESEGSVTIAF